MLKFVPEALSISGLKDTISAWKDTVKNEMLSLEQNRTWDLLVLLPGKKAVGYR